jgi:hypothetical protein
MTPEQMKIVVSEIQARHNPREAGLADFCRQLIGRIESLEIQLADEKAASARYAASLAQMPAWKRMEVLKTAHNARCCT